ncbi:tyrosine-specific transport protein [Gammaproteobacteria bacterium]
MNVNKFIGSVLVVIGTMIGAGMLALPLVSAQAGFVWASFVTIAVWVLMTVTGLLVLEVNLALDCYACSFSSMAEKTLGKIGKLITWLVCLLLLYALTAAYMSGASCLLTNILETHFHIRVANFISAILFTLVFGGMVFWSTRATDYANRGLISIKGALLFITIASLLPQIDVGAMLHSQHIATSGKCLFAMVPIFLCAFGYHTVIPSLRIYIGDKPKELKQMIVCGTTVALIIYLLWLATTLGVVPMYGENSFSSIAQNNSSVDGLVNAITLLVHSKWVSIGVNGFSNVAMTTSFLGVTLGLFDFLADGCKRPNSRFGRTQTALITFVPPLIFAFYFPGGFVLALKYAAIFVAILEIILPALMVYKLRQNAYLHAPHLVRGGNVVLLLIAAIGFALIFLQLLNSLI